MAVFFTTIRADISCLHKEGASISLVSAELSDSLGGRWLQIKLVHRWDYKCNSSIMRIKRKGILGFMAAIRFVEVAQRPSEATWSMCVPKEGALQVQPLEKCGCEEGAAENKRQVFSLSC